MIFLYKFFHSFILLIIQSQKLKNQNHNKQKQQNDSSTFYKQNYFNHLKILQANTLFYQIKMKFLKQNRKYITNQLQGNISNILRFELKDLYKTQKIQQFQTCTKCNALMIHNNCLFCGNESQYENKEMGIRNFICQRINKTEIKTYESMILCIDLSGSMNCSYPTKYKKINKDYVIRALGAKNFTIIANIIGQAEVIKNFKGIQVLFQSGQSIRDIAYTFKQQILREKQLNYQKNKNKISQNQPVQEQEWEYITRKQIIQVGVAKYIEQIKKNRPSTLITVVYFNSNIQIPVDNFADKIPILEIENKTIEEMVELGQFYADKISISPVTQVEEKLISNMTKSEAEGQTALSPAIAFCIGLAKKFKHDLNQIVVVTDGLSNVGFGQTQQQANIQQSKAIYKQLAIEYAVPNACVVNVIGFQDCAISYDVIDQLVSKTGGIPYNICFTTQKNQKIVTSQTIDYLKLEMVTGFLQGCRQFCYDTRIAVRASNPQIKISCGDQYKKFIKLQDKNCISLQLGIKSINEKFDFLFTVQNPNFQDQYVKFSVLVQYKRKSKINFVLREQLISVRKGDQQQAIKDQCKTLKMQIIKKLQVSKMQELNFEEYKELQQKINQNAKISQNIQEQILQKFKKKKQLLDQYEKNTDKLTKDKRSMMSRRHQTYKRRQISQQQQQENDGFL